MNLQAARSVGGMRRVRPTHGPNPFGHAARMADAVHSVEALTAWLERDVSPQFAGAAAAVGTLIRRRSKRVRPYLCLLGYDAAAEVRELRSPGAAHFAGALELLHTFLLIHDDVADRAESRRGGASLHVLLRPDDTSVSPEERRRVGEQLAVVAGDWLYTRALQAMFETPLVGRDRLARAIAGVLDVCRATAEGQHSDLALSARALADVRPEEVLDVYRLKTGRYSFESPLVSGAMLAGASSELCEALTRCSAHLGVAFQLEDDLIGLFETDEDAGKPGLADLREAKKTWPLVMARLRAGLADRRWLDELFARRDAQEADLLRVKALVQGTGVLDASVREINSRCDAARQALDVDAAAAARLELTPLIEWIRTRALTWQLEQR